MIRREIWLKELRDKDCVEGYKLLVGGAATVLTLVFTGSTITIYDKDSANFADVTFDEFVIREFTRQKAENVYLWEDLVNIRFALRD